MIYKLTLTDEERELIQKLLVVGRASILSHRLDKKVLEQLEIKVAITLPEKIS